jgi:DnaJ-class molecular chaperone
MRKDFNQLNYYEMLDLQPNAVPYEIRHAYNAAMQLYQPGSLVSYSFFSEKERREILSLIEKDYQTRSTTS